MGKGKVVALAVGLALFIGLGMWGSLADGGPVIPQPDVTVKAIPSYALDIQPFLGAHGYIPKNVRPELLLRLLEGVFQGEAAIAPAVAVKIQDRLSAPLDFRR